MNLSVVERVMLLNILPKEGDILTIKVVRKLREDLSFSEEEFKTLGIKFEDGALNYNKELAVDKDVSIKDKAKEIIAEALKELNTKKQLTIGCVSLWEKFIKE